MKTYPLYLNGEFVTTSKLLPVKNPATEQVFAQMSAIDRPRLTQAIKDAHEAFAGWRESPGHNANLLMPQATRFGVAMAKDPRTSLLVYWAMEVAAEPEKKNDAGAALLTSSGGLVAVHP